MKHKIDVSSLVNREQLSGREQLTAIWWLSLPAILAQMVSIVMQYIDAAMVGSMGANASASIGLVASSCWLMGGLCSRMASGFSVQVAQAVGANNMTEARQLVKQALTVAAAFSLLLSSFGIIISPLLPVWLGAGEAIRQNASDYFFISAAAIPIIQINRLGNSILQCSGNIRVPSILNASMCILDIFFNFLFIFPTREVMFGNAVITVPGLGLGVAGAALGTAMAELTIALILTYIFLFWHRDLKLRRGDRWIPTKRHLSQAFKISTPMAVEHLALCGAMVAGTRIVSPLGAVALSANSFAVTAESLCYMPGYGIGTAATALVGQSIGAGKLKLARRFSWMTVFLGMGIMALSGAIMYVIAPYVFAMLTPDKAIRELGTRVLRIEVFAEPLYGASIVASGALCGAGDTLVPSLLNLISIWGVRITLSLLLVGPLGLVGAWIAMCIELCFRGSILLIRLKRERWMKGKLETE